MAELLRIPAARVTISIGGQPCAWSKAIPLPEDSVEERVAQSMGYYRDLLGEPIPEKPPVLVVLGRRPTDLEWQLRHRKRRRNHK